MIAICNSKQCCNKDQCQTHADNNIMFKQYDDMIASVSCGDFYIHQKACKYYFPIKDGNHNDKSFME